MLEIEVNRAADPLGRVRDLARYVRVGDAETTVEEIRKPHYILLLPTGYAGGGEIARFA